MAVSRGRVLGGVVALVVLVVAGCADRRPEPAPLVTDVVWEDGAAPSGGLWEDPRVLAVLEWERVLLASWNAMNFSDPRALEAFRDLMLGRMAREVASDVLAGEPRGFVGPPPWAPLAVEVDEGGDEQDGPWTVVGCLREPESWVLEEGEVVDRPVGEVRVAEFHVVREPAEGGGRLRLVDVYESAPEGRCEGVELPVARYDPAPDPQVLGDRTPEMVIDTDGEPVEPVELLPW